MGDFLPFPEILIRVYFTDETAWTAKEYYFSFLKRENLKMCWVEKSLKDPLKNLVPPLPWAGTPSTTLADSSPVHPGLGQLL